MQLNTYLHFDDQCEAAFAFYQQVLGGELEGPLRFGGAEGCEQIPAQYAGRIMHVCLKIGDQMLMGSDSIPEMCPAQPISGFHVALHYDTEAETERAFNALAEGGRIDMPLQATFWAKKFGMLTDRFGVAWILNCSPDC